MNVVPCITIQICGATRAPIGGATYHEFVWPQHDRVLPASLHGQRFADEIPGVQVRTLAGVGHVPTYDDPELIVDTITDWIVLAYHPTDVG